MAKFIFSYRSAKSRGPVADGSELAAWQAFLNDVVAPNVVDPGWPVFEPATVLGEAEGSTQIGGYSVITADDLETAVSMARNCPTIARGGGVKVGVLAELPPGASGRADARTTLQGLILAPALEAGTKRATSRPRAGRPAGNIRRKTSDTDE